MKQTWTLHVRNFGPIQSADIDLHPFMMFVGPNNSGKSYLTTLIWGLLAQEDILFVDLDLDSPAYQACYDWVYQELENAKKYFKENSNENGDGYVSSFKENEIKLFVDCFNDVLLIKKEKLLKRLFNSNISGNQELRISNYSRNRTYKFDWKTVRNRIFKLKTDPAKVFVLLFLHYLIIGDFSSVVPVSPMDSNIFFRSSLYLPTARTGFMLNFRSLASSTFGQAFSLQDRPKGLHTAPAIRFLQGLIEMPPEEKGIRYADIIEWLEKEVINGRFVRRDNVLPDYYYKPQGFDQLLPLHVCSSLVTELAPLLLFLQGSDGYGSLIIEEPEAHLHPAAQRKVAQALVRLVNRGLPVWITTHSDIMFQQFNNLIALSNLPNRAEICQSMGYEESDILESNQAKAYQFIMKEGKTVVEPLRLIDTGFVAPSFIKVLGDLGNETIRLHDLTDELEDSKS